MKRVTASGSLMQFKEWSCSLRVSSTRTYLWKKHYTISLTTDSIPMYHWHVPWGIPNHCGHFRALQWNFWKWKYLCCQMQRTYNSLSIKHWHLLFWMAPQRNSMVPYALIWKNQFVRGNNQYPKDLTKAHVLLASFEQVRHYDLRYWAADLLAAEAILTLILKQLITSWQQITPKNCIGWLGIHW